MCQFDLTHNKTENGLRHASGLVPFKPANRYIHTKMYHDIVWRKGGGGEPSFFIAFLIYSVDWLQSCLILILFIFWLLQIFCRIKSSVKSTNRQNDSFG